MSSDQPGGVSVPTLVMTGGPLDGTAYPLPLTGRDCVLGSSMECDVQIMLGNVEPLHARVVFGPAGLAIADAGSATGTFVNGEKVESQHPLQDGDRVCLGPPGAKGSAKLLVLLPGARSGAAPRLAVEAVAPALFHGSDDAPALRDDGAPHPAAGEEPSGEIDLAAEAIFEADEVLSEGPRAAGPTEGAPLFAEPLPPAPAPPPSHSRAAVPPPPARPAAPPPPPPPPPPPERLTAPPPAAPPPPDYHADLPSIPVERPEEPPPQGDFPSLRPAPRPSAPAVSKGKGRPGVRRRRSISLPILPLLGGAAGLAALAGIVWFFFLRATPPELQSVTPIAAEPGKPVTLAGRHFAADAAGNTVLFGQARGQVTAASPTEITVVVPAGVKAQVPVIVQTKDGRSQPVSVTVHAAARAVGLEPDVAMPGQAVLVRGEGFEGQKVSAEVGGMAAPAVEATPEGARVTIPALPLPEGSKTSVVLKVGTTPARTFDLWIGRLPFVTQVVPARGAVGDRVVLKGRGFRPQPLANTVTFGGEAALVVSATDSELAVIAPPPRAGDIQPEQPVVVTVAGRASAGTSVFAVVRGATSGFVPRFFAAPVTEFPGEELVFVSTELGPVLLLGGPADAPTTAERAVKVSAALNALVAGAANRPPAFEARQSPQPAVGVVGEVTPFLVPTPEDAAAYSRDWETGRGSGRRVGAAALARHWAALLQDYFGLFLYRQRPLQMAALSTRGKVLTEIYGEANRRSPGGNTVPSSLVLPTPAGMATALRQMALVVSGDGGGRAAVAVEGRWDGTIEDPNLGTRRFELLVRSEGGRLAGTLTTWRGKVELKSPVRDIGFDRGNVRFTADLQGTAYRFRGLLEMNTVEGTIERAGKPPARFSLRFVE